MTKALFFHANGFPLSSYDEFFENLPWNIVGPQRFKNFDLMNSRIGWRPILNEVKEWILASEPDYIIGHSLGAVLSLWAISEMPHLQSKKIFLFDPVLFNWPRNFLIEANSKLGTLQYLLKEPKMALRRRDEFSDHQDAIDYFSKKEFFKNFTQKSLQNYVASMIESDNSYRLLISSHEEASVFKYMPGKPIYHFPRQHKLYWFYSENYPLVRPMDLNYWQRKIPHAQFIKMKGGHLFPFEYPQLLAQKVIDLSYD